MVRTVIVLSDTTNTLKDCSGQNCNGTVRHYKHTQGLYQIETVIVLSDTT